MFDITTGEQLRKITSPDSHKNDYFARSVALSGGLALVGAPERKSYDDGGRGGYVDVFDVNTGQWLRRFYQEDPEDFASFGYGMSLEGDLAVIGSYSKTGEDGRRGAVYYMDVRTGEILDKLTEPYFHEYDTFGLPIARDGGITAVGAAKYIGSNRTSGVLHIYHDIPEPTTFCMVVAGLGVVLGRNRDR